MQNAKPKEENEGWTRTSPEREKKNGIEAELKSKEGGRKKKRSNQSKPQEQENKSIEQEYGIHTSARAGSCASNLDRELIVGENVQFSAYSPLYPATVDGIEARDA